MTNYEKLRRKPSSFRMFTGLSAVEFDKLAADLEPVWLARKAKRSARRHRKPGAGRKAKLLLTDRVLLVLLYYRTYVTQEFVGFLFGVDKGTVSRSSCLFCDSDLADGHKNAGKIGICSLRFRTVHE